MNDGEQNGLGRFVEQPMAAQRPARPDEIHLLNVIDQLPDSYALFDADERLVIWNQHYAASMPDTGRPLQQGDNFEALIRAQIEHEAVAEAIGQEDAWIEKRLKAFRGPDKSSISIRYHDRVVDVRQIKTEDGGTLLIATDITEATERTEELQLARLAIDQISERVVVFGLDEKVRLINKENLDYYGHQPDRALGMHIGDLMGWDAYNDIAASGCEKILRDGTPTRHEYWRRNHEGETSYWETTLVPYREPDQTISGAIATSRDMTEQHRAEQVKQRFQEAIEHISDGYALFDDHECLVACNRYYRQKQSAFMSDFALGVSFETIIRNRVASGAILDAIGREETWIKGRLRSFRAESDVTTFRESSGKWTIVRNRKTADGNTLLVVTDITESKRIQEALAESRSRFEDFTELAADWFWELDAKGRYTYVSKSIEAQTGCPASEILGKNPIDVLGCNFFEDPRWQILWCELHDQGIDRTVDIEHDLRAANGQVYRVRSVIRPIKDMSGVIIGYRGVAKDLTEAHQLKMKLEYQAHHDALTSLPNRRSFERHLERAIKAGAAGRRSSVFCFIDLDQFKVINDTAGHLAGDRLLRKVADLLSTKIRDGDLLARLGGDEFGLLLRDCSIRRAQNMARKLITALNDDRFFHEDHVFEVGASIGLTPINASSQSSVSQILAEADLACYAAKDDGRNRIQTYQPGDRQLKRRRDEMSKSSLIHQALDEGRFVLFAQPIRPLGDPAEDGPSHEILLRMVGTDGSLLSPANFVPAAERYGLMVKIDRWVIRQSFAMLAERPDARVSINLSGISLNEPGLVGFIKRLIQSSPIAPQNVCFEITETAAIRSLTKTRSLIGQLKDIGCRFALDDFGSGLSSFSYLKQLPVDYLKIDGSFIRDILSDMRSKTMVEAIHHVARSLGLRTVAECVEAKEVAELLRSIGIDFIQGLAVGKPKPWGHWPELRKIAV